REVAALNTCCLVLAATYIWSGLAKLNPVFVGTTFPWLLEPFLGAAGEHAQWFVKHAGWLAPMVEFDAVFDRLPDPIQDYVTEEGPNRNGFSILDWSYGEMNVPAYPET